MELVKVCHEQLFSKTLREKYVSKRDTFDNTRPIHHLDPSDHCAYHITTVKWQNLFINQESDK